MEALLEGLVIFPNSLDEGRRVWEGVLCEQEIANVEGTCLLPGRGY